MLETKYVDDNCTMFLVANIDHLFTLATGTNIEIQSPTSTDGHQLQVPNIIITNEYHFENFYLTVEELKNEKLASEETYLMLESRLVDLFNEKVLQKLTILTKYLNSGI